MAFPCTLITSTLSFIDREKHSGMPLLFIASFSNSIPRAIYWQIYLEAFSLQSNFIEKDVKLIFISSSQSCIRQFGVSRLILFPHRCTEISTFYCSLLRNPPWQLFYLYVDSYIIALLRNPPSGTCKHFPLILDNLIFYRIWCSLYSLIAFSSSNTKCSCVFRHLGRQFSKFLPWLGPDHCEWHLIV